MRELEGLDGDVVSLGVEVRPVPLRRPRGEEVPPYHLLTPAVEEDDGAVLALDASADRWNRPVVHLAMRGQGPLEHDVRVLGHARQLARREGAAPLPVLDRVD